MEQGRPSAILVIQHTGSSIKSWRHPLSDLAVRSFLLIGDLEYSNSHHHASDPMPRNERDKQKLWRTGWSTQNKMWWANHSNLWDWKKNKTGWNHKAESGWYHDTRIPSFLNHFRGSIGYTNAQASPCCASQTLRLDFWFSSQLLKYSNWGHHAQLAKDMTYATAQRQRMWPAPQQTFGYAYARTLEDLGPSVHTIRSIYVYDCLWIIHWRMISLCYCLIMYLFVYLCIYLFIHSSIHSCIHLWTHLLIYLSIYLSN